MDEEKKKKIQEIIGVDGWVFLKSAIEMSNDGKRTIHVTNHKKILKNRKTLMKDFPNIVIMNRTEEKIYHLMRKNKRVVEAKAEELKNLLGKDGQQHDFDSLNEEKK